MLRHHIAFLQWTPFGILWDETLGETQTFFILTFLKRPSDEIIQERSLLLLLQQIGKNSDMFGFVVVEEFVSDLSSQFPCFYELFKTTNDGRIVHIEFFSQDSGYQAFALFYGC